MNFYLEGYIPDEIAQSIIECLIEQKTNMIDARKKRDLTFEKDVWTIKGDKE